MLSQSTISVIASMCLSHVPHWCEYYMAKIYEAVLGFKTLTIDY